MLNTIWTGSLGLPSCHFCLLLVSDTFFFLCEIEFHYIAKVGLAFEILCPSLLSSGIM